MNWIGKLETTYISIHSNIYIISVKISTISLSSLVPYELTVSIRMNFLTLQMVPSEHQWFLYEYVNFFTLALLWKIRITNIYFYFFPSWLQMQSKFMVEKILNTEKQKRNHLSHKTAKITITISVYILSNSLFRLYYDSAFVCFCFDFLIKVKNTRSLESNRFYNTCYPKPHAHFPLSRCNY